MVSQLTHRFLTRATWMILAVLCGLQTWSAEVIQPGKTGEQLRESLRSGFSSQTILSYRDARKAMFGEIDNVDGKVRLVYTGSRFPTTTIPNANLVNTEHTWPQSKFRGASQRHQMKSDLHHLFPTWNRVNGERANSPFGDIPDSETDAWWIDNTATRNIPTTNRDAYSESVPTLFEPREDHKGNVARAMFYFFTMYEKRGIDTSWFFPQVPTLMAWHLSDPVDEAESKRNEAILRHQGNLNPFILDETLAQRIFATGGSGTASARADHPTRRRPSARIAAERGRRPTARSSSATASLTGELEIHCLDVDQGDCTLVVCPNGFSVLIDCGSFTDGPAMVNRTKAYLSEHLPGDEIDVVLITHPDADHYQLLPEVLADFQINKLLHVGTASEHGVNDVDAWIDGLASVVEIIEAHELDSEDSPSDLFDSGDVEFHIIAADVEGSFSEKNARSIVVRIDHDEFEAILTGDATFETEEEIVLGYSSKFLDVELLKIGHHGSSFTSTSSGWVEMLRPQTAIVSAGFNSPFDHPRQSVIERVAESTVQGAPPHFMRWGVRQGGNTFLQTVADYDEAIFNTGSNGHIVITTDGSEYKIKYGRPGRLSGEMVLTAETATDLGAERRSAAVRDISISKASMMLQADTPALSPRSLRIRAMELETMDPHESDESPRAASARGIASLTNRSSEQPPSMVNVELGATALIGKRVSVTTSAGTVVGVLKAVGADGWLQVREDRNLEPTLVRGDGMIIRILNE